MRTYALLCIGLVLAWIGLSVNVHVRCTTACKAMLFSGKRAETHELFEVHFGPISWGCAKVNASFLQLELYKRPCNFRKRHFLTLQRITHDLLDFTGPTFCRKRSHEFGDVFLSKDL